MNKVLSLHSHGIAMASSYILRAEFKTRGHTFICYDDYKSPQHQFFFFSWRSSSYWLSSCPLLQSSDFDFIKYSKQKSCLIHAAKNVWGHIISRGDPPLLHLISPLISVYLGNIKMDLNITSFLHRSFVGRSLWHPLGLGRIHLLHLRTTGKLRTTHP